MVLIHHELTLGFYSDGGTILPMKQTSVMFVKTYRTCHFLRLLITGRLLIVLRRWSPHLVRCPRLCANLVRELRGRTKVQLFTMLLRLAVRRSFLIPPPRLLLDHRLFLRQLDRMFSPRTMYLMNWIRLEEVRGSLNSLD